MTYVSMASRLKLSNQMRRILLRNQERMKKVAAQTAANFEDIGWN